MNGASSDMSSLEGESDHGDISDIEPDKMDPAHREILEKLKRQEKEEREEIERELIEHRAAMARQQAEDLRVHTNKNGHEDRISPKDTRPSDLVHDRLERQDHSEIRLQRPLGLLAQHGLSLGKPPLDRHLPPAHPAELYGYHPAYLDRLYHERAYPPTPPSRNSDSHPAPVPPPHSNGSPPSHWSYEEQFKQVRCVSEIFYILFACFYN